MINIKEDEKLNKLNHSCAHLLAQAVKHLYPEAKYWVGPVIEEGFYYDIDLGDKVLTEDDLPAIEKEMKKCAKDNKRIVREEISKEEALKRIKYRLILEEIIKSEKIKVTDKEIEDKVEEMATKYNMTKEEVKKQYGENLDYIRYDLEVNKAFDIIKGDK